MDDVMQRLVASPACVPQLPLDAALDAYARLGFRNFEAFTQWAGSHLDVTSDPAAYVAAARERNMRYTSMHLPPVKGAELDVTLAAAVQASRFAEAIGAGVVLFKADSREAYIKAGRRYLDLIDEAGIGVTPVLQNHKGTPITSLGDFRQVIDGINDARMKHLLEVGHFHRAGVLWRDGYELLAGRIALVHINEIRGDQSVSFGTGEVDFAGLFDRLASDGYAGHIVVELELDTRDTDHEHTLREIGQGIDHLKAQGLEKLA
ncbi:MAG: sugar phosphate isomerase/epimerase family protein [Phycisphaeraceae bacterium]